MSNFYVSFMPSKLPMWIPLDGLWPFGSKKGWYRKISIHPQRRFLHFNPPPWNIHEPQTFPYIIGCWDHPWPHNFQWPSMRWVWIFSGTTPCRPKIFACKGETPLPRPLSKIRKGLHVSTYTKFVAYQITPTRCFHIWQQISEGIPHT